MSEEPRPSRRPFGERSEEERQIPFGDRSPRRWSPDSDSEEEPPARSSRFDSSSYTAPEEAPVYDSPSEDDYPPPTDDSDYELPDLDDFLVEPEQVESEDVAEEDDDLYTLPDLDDLDFEGDRYSSRAPEWTEEDEAELAAEADPEPKPVPSWPVTRRQAEADAKGESQPAQTGIRLGLVIQTFGLLILTGISLATLFTWWTPDSFLPPESADRLAIALATQAGVEGLPTTPVPTSESVESVPVTTIEQPQFTETPPEISIIGIVSGHRGTHRTTGLPDPGAVCADGLTEREVNENVATQVVALLEGEGYQIDLLDEFDTRLTDYKATALVSIHSDSCEYVNEYATGFKVASLIASESATAEQDQVLVRCLIDNYTEATGLSFHPSVTYDMADYHTFWEIAPSTPGAIIEIGFMYLDRELLTQHSDQVALGIARGILCYVNSDTVEAEQP